MRTWPSQRVPRVWSISPRHQRPLSWRKWATTSSLIESLGRGTGAHGACYKGTRWCAPGLATSVGRNAVCTGTFRSGMHTKIRIITWSWDVYRGHRHGKTLTTLGTSTAFPSIHLKARLIRTACFQRSTGRYPSHREYNASARRVYYWRPGASLTHGSKRAVVNSMGGSRYLCSSSASRSEQAYRGDADAGI